MENINSAKDVEISPINVGALVSGNNLKNLIKLLALVAVLISTPVLFYYFNYIGFLPNLNKFDWVFLIFWLALTLLLFLILALVFVMSPALYFFAYFLQDLLQSTNDRQKIENFLLKNYFLPYFTLLLSYLFVFMLFVFGQFNTSYMMPTFLICGIGIISGVCYLLDVQGLNNNGGSLGRYFPNTYRIIVTSFIHFFVWLAITHMIYFSVDDQVQKVL